MTGPQVSRRIGRRPTRIERHCLGLGCGALFLAKPSEIARGGGQFCSAVCRTLARRKLLDRAAIGKPETGPAATDASSLVPARPRPPPPTALVCRTCGSIFRVYSHRALPGRRAKFCSRACIVSEPSSNARRTPKFGNDECQQCGEPVVVRADQRSSRAAAARWCSIECTAAYFRTKGAARLAR